MRQDVALGIAKWSMPVQCIDMSRSGSNSGLVSDNQRREGFLNKDVSRSIDQWRPRRLPPMSTVPQSTVSAIVWTKKPAVFYERHSCFMHLLKDALPSYDANEITQVKEKEKTVTIVSSLGYEIMKSATRPTSAHLMRYLIFADAIRIRPWLTSDG